MSDTPDSKGTETTTPAVDAAPETTSFESAEDLEFFPGLEAVIAKHAGASERAEAPADESDDASEEFEDDASADEDADEDEGDGDEDEGEGSHDDPAGVSDPEPLDEEDEDEDDGDVEGDGDKPDLTSKQRAYLTHKEAELLRRDQVVAQREAAVQRVIDDPYAGLEALGLKPADVAALILYKDLGEDAPAELKQRFERQSVDARIRALEEGKGQRPPAQEKQADSPAFEPAEVKALDREIVAVTQNLPASMPFLQASAEEDARSTYLAICQVAEASLVQGKWLSAVEAAKQLETQMRSDWDRYSKLQSTAKKKADSKQGTRKRKKTKKVPTGAASKRKPKRSPLEDEADPYSDRFEDRAIKVLKARMAD